MPNDYLRLIDTPTGANVATGAVPESSNPYMATLDRDEEMRRARFRASVSTAMDANPDEVARQRRVAQILGRPPAVVEALPEEASRAARMRMLESETMDAPALRRQMIDEGFARVAHDDVSNLSQLERLMRAPELRAPSGPAMSLRSFFGGLGSSFVQGSERVRQGIRQQFADAVGFEPMARDAARRGEQATFREFLSTPEIESLTGRAAYGGLQSLVRQVPGLAASIATRSVAPALSAAGVQTQAEAYGKYRGRDASGAEAFLAATGEGAVEVLTELIPLSTMLGAFGRGGKTMAMQFAKGIAQDLVGEQAATVLQDAIDTAVANPNKTWGDYWSERPEAAYTTFISSLVQSGIMGSAHAAAARLARQERAAENAEPQAQGLASLAQVAQASKLAGRDPDSFEAFVKAAAEDGPVTDVYVDAQVLFQLGVAQQITEVSPTVAAQIEAAMQSGGQVRIPIEEFAARIATTDAAGPLLDHLKTEPDGFSRAEATEFMAEQGEILRVEVERQMTEQQADSTFRASQEAVRQQVLTELNAAGRFTSQVNEFNATLIAARTAVRAAQLDMTPEAFFERQMLRVRAQGMGGEVLNQPATIADVTQAWANLGVDGAISERGGLITLSRIVAQEQGQGAGTAAMQALTEYADRTGQRIALSPSADFGGDKKRLTEFYGRFGFAPNTGRSRDLSVSETMLREPQAFNQPAYHGTPHNVDQFSTDFIGTGEGAQAYGWGLYFAEDPGVAGGYHRALAEAPGMKEMRLGSMILNERNGFDYSRKAGTSDLENIRASLAEDVMIAENDIRGQDFAAAVLRILDEKIEGYRQDWPEGVKAAETLRNMLSAPNALRIEYYPAAGGVYQVDIPDEAVETFLLWDKPLSEQPESVREALGKVRIPKRALKELNAWDAADLAFMYQDESGEGFYNLLASALGEQKEASQALRKVGIQGIKYLDGNSRSDGSGSFNLVVFDGSIVKITHKDGRPVTQAERDAYLQGTVAQDARGTFSPNTNTISLLKRANLSTFLHESAHYFFENDLALAFDLLVNPQRTAGEQQIVDDASALLRWHGFTGPVDEQLQAWRMLSFEEKRAYHERTAESFEAYLFEGRAPSIELQRPFQQFRAWLVNVYTSIKDFLARYPEAGTLNDDVRGVFDRMLATTEQIQIAEQARSQMPLFESAGQAGMTEEAFAAYQRLGIDATNEAVQELQAKSLRDMQWRHNARGRVLAKLKRESADARKAIRAEVRNEVMSEPVYRAWTFLTGKPKADPADGAAEASPDVAVFGKIATDTLAEYPEVADKIKALRMTRKDGLHPDAVAEMFGFTSGDHLLTELANALPPREQIEAATDARMLEENAELATPEAIEREADRAIHNEVRARMVAAELNALDQAMNPRRDAGTDRRGRRRTVAILPEAAKGFAAEMIARQRIRDIRPGQYAGAETRAANAAMKAVKAGDTAQAATEKRNQMINIYATRAAYDAQDEVKAGVAYLRKLDAGVKSIDPAYTEQIQAMLERFDLRAQSNVAIDRKNNLAEWLASQEEQGLSPDIPDNLRDESQRKNYREMTVEEFRGLVDTVKQIEHLGRLKNRLMTARDQRQYEAVRDEITASIRENGGAARPLKLEPDSRITRLFKTALAEHRKFGSLARQMDGGVDGGPMWDAIVRPMNEAGAKESLMTEQATLALADIYAPVLALPGGITGDKRYIPEINNSLSRGGRMSIALNWGNSTNRQRVMDGDGWSEAQVQAILRTLSPVELATVNRLWEYIDSYWPQTAEKQKRVYGVAPEKVEAEPFDAVASDGSVVRMRGGYYPLKYDAARASRAESNERAEVARDMLKGAFTASTTRRGHTKQRAENVGMPVRKDLDVVTEHVVQVTHDLAWHEWLIDANRLMRSRHIGDAIREHYGAETLSTMKDDIEAIAAGDAQRLDAIDRGLRVLRANVSRSVMGLSFTTAMLQPFGLANSMVRIGVAPVLRGLSRWIGDGAKLESSMTWIGQKSDFMRLRSKTFNREISEIANRVGGKSKAMTAVDGSLFFLTTKLQMVADVPTWIGRYEQAIEQGADEAKAVALADQAVIDAQGAGAIKDLAQVQRKHPMLTQFYSYFSATYNLAAERTGSTDFKNPKAVAGWLGDMTLLMVAPALAPAIVLMLLRGEDDEDLAKKLLEAQAGYMLGNIVGLREFSGAISGFPYSGPPVSRIVVDTGKAAQQVAQGELDEPAVMAIVRLLGTGFGIPTTQAIRSYRGWTAWEEGDAPPTSILFGPPQRD